MLFENNDYLKMFYDMKDDNQKLSLGFLKGNMFNDEYEPYKNYRYAKLTPKNKKEEDLFEIMSLCFAINDYNLYLDLFPDDKKVLDKFNECIKKLEKSTQNEEYKLNKIYLNDFTWATTSWPWEKDGNYYV